MIKSQPDLANWFDNANYTADIFHKLNELNPQIHSFDTHTKNENIVFKIVLAKVY